MNDFRTDLAWANSEKLEPFWLDVYKEFFTDLHHMTGTIGDMEMQRVGIDRVVTLGNGKNYFIDEKLLRHHYDEISLEFVSVHDDGRRTRGWMEKPLAIDYLAYAFAPSRTCYLFDWPSLRRCWRYYGEKWKSEYKIIASENKRYTTFCVAVPTDLLMSKCSGAKKIVVNP